MLNWALTFFVCAIISAFVGFTDIPFNLRLMGESAADIAKILFVVFVLLFLVSLVFGLLQEPKPRI